MALDLSTLTSAQQIAAIYIGYYDRAADPFGNGFWDTALANPSLSLEDIASDFATQAETLIAYPFLGDPTEEEANAFITEVYLNLFNREPDAEGLAFWSSALIAAINGDEGALSVGEIILSIIGGAQDVEGGTQDLTTITNKINVAVAWTEAADAAGLNEETSYGDSPTAQASAKSIIEGVTSDEATVIAAKADVDAFFDSTAPVVDGDTFFLTSATDVMTGTDDNDEFLGYLQQNPFAGGVSNSLSSAERLDGAGGEDRLYAELSYEFLGVDASGASVTDIQPRLSNIEVIDIEARDTDANSGRRGAADIIVDGKHITDHVELNSYYSDGDLKFENVTTLTSSGNARNTGELSVGMDHTDNFNSDRDASDLTVLFDNDYLLSGQQNESAIVYFLLDEDAELEGNPDRLANIDVDGIIFNVLNADGTVTEVVIEADEANIAGTHEGFVAALQAPFQAAIDAGLVPAGSLLFLDPTQTDVTFDDGGNQSDDIPGIAVVSGDGTELVATGFSRIEEQIGQYDVYGRFDSSGQNTIDDPISINIDLHKAGRGGEGGDLIVGGKSEHTADGIADGIEVFNINVLGAGNDDPNGGLTKPSNVGTITSTGDELTTVYIATDAEYAAGDTYASLTVRNGFDQSDDSDEESGDLKLINADEFLGDLTLGDIDANRDAGRITNADMITAQGGGDVTLGLLYDGHEEAQAYTVYTGAGNDEVDAELDGDSTDYYGSSLMISTGDGNDDVYVDTHDFGRNDNDNEQLNQAILDNIDIYTGAGDDYVESTAGSRANLNIDTGTGNDVIDTSGGSPYQAASWAYNYDDARSGPSSNDQPGVPTSLAYVGGATVTVTLSGAGVYGNLQAGGGVMADEVQNMIEGTHDGAINKINGYEGTATVQNLLSGNQFFGDQRDVNAAIIEAIEGDAVLSELLDVEVTENNTLVITSKTGGHFDPSDLKIEISQNNVGSGDDWNSVESEARSVFSDSGIVITDLADANGADAGPEVPNLLTTYGDDTEDHLDSTNDWFTGLTAGGDNDNNASDYTQIYRSHASQRETDNVITPGEGDDLVIMSTEAGDAEYKGSGDYGAPRQVIADEGETDSVGDVSSFTRIDGNTLQNGASNETLVFEGLFGDDTLMNFTTGDPETYEIIEIDNDASIKYTYVGEDAVSGVSETFAEEEFTIELSDAETGETGPIIYGDGDSHSVAYLETDSATQIALLIEAAGDVIIGGVTFTPVAVGETVVFTESSTPNGGSSGASISSFLDPAGVVVGFVENNPGDGNGDGVSSVSETQTEFTVCFGDADTDTSYTFDGETVPVLENQTGENIAEAFGSGAYVNWTANWNGDDSVTFTAVAYGSTPIPDISEFVGTNVPGDTVESAETYNAGLDFLDYSDYLTSQHDASSGPGPDGSDSHVLKAVTLDYNEDNTLGGEGDGSSNTNVEANEVAIVRMANDTTDGETYSGLSASDVEALFNNDGSYTGFGDDSSYGNLDAANFSVQDYTKTGENPDLIGDGKAIFKVENPNNLGEYKVFELTWSGDNASASGTTVSAREIGTQDYGTSLNGLDDINLVGSDTYGELISEGFADFMFVS